MIKLEAKLKECLRAAINSTSELEWKVAVRETIRFYYPDLNEKQLAVCEEVIHMLWDLDGLRPMDEVVFRKVNPSRFESRLFSSKKEVLGTIAELKQKNVLWEKVTIWTIECAEKTISRRKRIIGFVSKDVENKALFAMGEGTCRSKVAFTDS